MNENQVTGNKTVSSDFLQVLLALKQNVMRDLNVAEICRVTTVNEHSGEYRCSLITNEQTSIICTKLQDLEIEQGDVVLVLFTSTDFRVNLAKLKKNQKIQEEKSTIYHSKNYGIVVGLIYREE